MTTSIAQDADAEDAGQREELDRRTEQARQRWLKSHPSAYHGPITETAVSEILVVLAEHGVPPTVRAVRQVYGSGSPNSITPWLRNAWMRKDLISGLKQREHGGGIPVRLIQFWETLVADAKAEAQKSITQDKHALDEERAVLSAYDDSLRQRETLMDERVASAQAQLGLLEASIAELRTAAVERAREVDGLEATLRQRDTDVQRLQAQVHELTTQLVVVNKDLALAQQEKCLALAEVQSLKERGQEQKAQLFQSQEEARRASDRAAQAFQERSTLEVEVAQLRTQLSFTHDATSKLASAEKMIEAMRESLAKAEDRHKVMASDLFQHQQTIARLHALTTVQEHVENDLKRTREELATLRRDHDFLLKNPPALLARIDAIERSLKAIAERNSTP